MTVDAGSDRAAGRGWRARSAARSRWSPAARSRRRPRCSRRGRCRSPASTAASGATPTAPCTCTRRRRTTTLDRLRNLFAALRVAPPRAAARGQGRQRSRCTTAAAPGLAIARPPHAAPPRGATSRAYRGTVERRQAAGRAAARRPRQGDRAIARLHAASRRSRTAARCSSATTSATSTAFAVGGQRSADWREGGTRSHPRPLPAPRRRRRARRGSTRCRRSKRPRRDARACATPRSRADRQRTHRPPGRAEAAPSSGAASRASTATRCSARCSTSAARDDARGLFAIDLVDCVARRAGVRAQHRGAVDAPDRPAPAARSRSSTACRASVQHGRMFHADDARAARAARRGTSAHRSCGCARRPRTGALRPRDHRRQPPHPLRRRRTSRCASRPTRSLTAICEERPFLLEDTLHAAARPRRAARRGIGRRSAAASSTRRSRSGASGCAGSAIPFEWQAAVIRAAITLKLNAFDDTGAIVAAMTTSIPEAPARGRNWDYRYCWLRDGYFVVDALNRLGATATMEALPAATSRRSRPHAGESALQPVYRDQRRCARSTSAIVDVAAGLSRHGAGARRQRRLPAGPARRLRRRDARRDARVLRRAARARAATRRCSSGSSRSAQRALALHDQPDAGLWELRGSAARAHVLERHVLGRVRPPGADRRAAGTPRRARSTGAPTPQRIRAVRATRAAGTTRAATFVADRRRRRARREPAAARRARISCAADDPRFAATVDAIERELKRGDFVFRYVEQDDFGAPDERVRRVHVLVRQRARGASAAATRRARCSSSCSRCRNRARPARRARRPGDAASRGATSCRPTAWSG